MSLPWIEALVAGNEEVVACERRFHRHCILIAELAANGQVTAEDEVLLASSIARLTLLRAHRDSLLADVTADA
ncbi:hypothetical protein [Methylobacterium fujisawaense]|uniref:hypothetical protein n=1 Tax=Methylobacterium fujisawaense TaxID=107400 RepID=UPI00313D628F